MRVTLNGRDMAERVSKLEQRELQYFEVIKTAVVYIVGAVIVFCLPGVIYAVTGLDISIGKSVADAYQSLR